MSTVHTLVLLSALLAAVTVAVLAGALIMVRRGLLSASENLAKLDAALKMVESEHLQPLEPAVQAVNAQFDTVLERIPGIARKAAVVAERRPR